LLAASAAAQSPLTPKAQAGIAYLFDKAAMANPLDCHVETRKPFLDFSFRYEIGYIVRCGIGQFNGAETRLGMLLRVTPLHGSPTVLGESFLLPAIPEEAKVRVNLKRLHAEVQFSGVYAAGEGAYENELVVTNEQNRIFRKTWHVRTAGWGLDANAPMALKPLQIQAISLPQWQGSSGSGTGLRLTVLLDAAPAWPYSTALRAWDRAFLLGSLSSLLRQLPLASVRIVAFNLDQQQEVYRDEDFDRYGIGALAEALTKLELGSVSYQVLQRDRGWAELLRRLLREETGRAKPSDAVIFLGPAQRFRSSAEVADMTPVEPSIPVFYFEYSPHAGAEFPDAIEHLTRAFHGTTFKLHSPEDLAEALSKMQKKLARREGMRERMVEAAP
jgi:hypothetical protein